MLRLRRNRLELLSRTGAPGGVRYRTSEGGIRAVHAPISSDCTVRRSTRGKTKALAESLFSSSTRAFSVWTCLTPSQVRYQAAPQPDADKRQGDILPAQPPVSNHFRAYTGVSPSTMQVTPERRSASTATSSRSRSAENSRSSLSRKATTWSGEAHRCR